MYVCNRQQKRSTVALLQNEQTATGTTAMWRERERLRERETLSPCPTALSSTRTPQRIHHAWSSRAGAPWSRHHVTVSQRTRTRGRRWRVGQGDAFTYGLLGDGAGRARLHGLLLMGSVDGRHVEDLVKFLAGVRYRGDGMLGLARLG